MPLSAALLPEYDHEMADTRKSLERVPNDKFGWKPHEKSMTLGRLASHLVDIPGWGAFTIQQEVIDIAPVGGPAMQGLSAKSRQELLDAFDRNVAATRAALAGASDEQLMKTFTLLAGGKTVFSMPRIAVLRGSILNHSIHHRAQLGVYLRLNNVPVPSIYGPSADEGAM